MTIAQAKATGHRAHLFEPTVENRRATTSAGPLRVVAFNAQGGTSFEGILRCFARQPLRGAAIVLLSEADVGIRRSGGRKVASELARALGMSCAYVPEFGLVSADGTMRAFLGSAILSREPMEDVVAIPLPRVTERSPHVPGSLGRVRREGSQAALVASVRLRGNPVYVSVAHLDSRAHPNGRDLQIAAMLEGFPSGGPAIFGGDLNTTTVELVNRASVRLVLREMFLNSRRFRHPHAHEPLLARLAEAGFEVRGANAEGRPTFTFTRMIPPWMRPKLDWIALRGLKPMPGTSRVIPARPGFLAFRVSDHDFIAVDVAL